MTEQSFTTAVIKWARAYKWRVHHIRNSGFGGMTVVQGDRGFPDLILVRGKRWIAAELKIDKAGTKRGEPKPEQRAWLDSLAAVGAETHTWRPQMWSEILVVLSKP